MIIKDFIINCVSLLSEVIGNLSQGKEEAVKNKIKIIKLSSNKVRIMEISKFDNLNDIYNQLITKY